MIQDEITIGQVIDQFLRSYQRQDIDGSIALLSSDQPFLSLGTNVNEVFTTPSDVRTSLAKDFRTMRDISWGTYRHCALTATATLAQALLELPLTFTAEGKTQHLTFRFAFAFQKQQGQCRIALAMRCIPYAPDNQTFQ
jgi:SnoaL-like domain